MDQQPKKTRRAHSHLFTLRFWFEWKDEDHKEVRGQAAHVLSGKGVYFRDWSALVSFLEEALAVLEEEGAAADGARDGARARSNDQGDRPLDRKFE